MKAVTLTTDYDKVDWLQVGVDDIAHVNLIDHLDHLLPVEANHVRAELLHAALTLKALNDLRQVVVALLHHNEQLAVVVTKLVVVHSHDPFAVSQRGEQLDLIAKAVQHRLVRLPQVDRLQRQGALSLQIKDLVDDGGAAPPQPVQHLVVPSLDGDRLQVATLS